MAVAHAVFLEAGTSPQALSEYMESIRVGTFDLGVEFSLNAVAETPLRTLYPWCSFGHSCGARRVEDEDPHDEFGVPDADADISLGLRSMLAVPGPLHIIDNATKSLLDHMPFIAAGVDAMTALSRFLSGNATKKRLIATCFSGALSRVFAKNVQSFSQKIHLKRWGSLAFGVAALLELKRALEKFFDMGKYQMHAVEKEGETVENDGVRIEAIAESIASPAFWGKVATLEKIAAVVRSLISWVEACPCHDTHEAIPERTEAWAKCPLRSRRLSEIATGTLFQVLHRVSCIQAAALFMELDQVDSEIRSACLRDFERGRGHLVFQLTLKFACFFEPPLLLLAAASPLPGKESARKAALRRCKSSSCAHPLVRRLQNGHLSDEVTLFLEGESLGLLPELSMFLGELFFGWGSERQVEGGHARINVLTSSKRNRTESFDSLILRMSEIEKTLNSESASTLLDCLSSARSPKSLIQQLGMERHPGSWMGAVLPSGALSRRRPQHVPFHTHLAQGTAVAARLL